MSLESVNPASGELVTRYAGWSDAELESAVERAGLAAGTWRESTAAERRALLASVAARLAARRAELSTLMTREMGKPIVQAEAEVDKCAFVCTYFAERAEAILREERTATEASDSYIRFDPLGCVLAIMPWNFPLWQVFRFAAPALAAGNVVLLKHAPNVTGCGLAIDKLFEEAGAPEGVFTTLPIEVEAVARVIAHPAVAAVTLTGSPHAGRVVAAQAGAHLKKTVLELGGSDPFIVLADADLEAAVEAAVLSRTQNSGQSCIAAKRFIVESEIHDQFEEAFAAALARRRVGDPASRDTHVGPLARADLRATLDGQVRASVAAGARPVLGGRPRSGPGFYYDVTLLSGAAPGMRVFDEETFGPVAALCRARDVSEAVRLANRSAFGLGANVWTSDLDRARELARRLEAGSVAVNTFVKSDPRMPFGGVRQSGYGRELSAFGLREFVNAKSVWVA